jgi:hypothetical protein
MTASEPPRRAVSIAPTAVVSIIARAPSPADTRVVIEASGIPCPS